MTGRHRKPATATEVAARAWDAIVYAYRLATGTAAPATVEAHARVARPDTHPEV